MLLIRPWLRMNKYRVSAHHVTFFIFIVSNVGGCLTPVGDPPLFLGCLMGVPFWWVATRGYLICITGVGVLLLMFFAVDTKKLHCELPCEASSRTTNGPFSEEWRFDGVEKVFFLAIVLGAVFINHPPFLREALMVEAAVASYFTTKKRSVHESNHFSLGPVKEVAILFVGIFATMMPALEWMQASASNAQWRVRQFLASISALVSLSSVLDNAPTYLCFLQGGIWKIRSRPILSRKSSQLVHRRTA